MRRSVPPISEPESMPLAYVSNLIGKARLYLPGFLLCVVVTAVANGMAWTEAMLFGRSWIEPLVIAILVGTIIRSLWTPPAYLQSGISYSGKQVLEFAVVLLGSSVSAEAIISAGPELFLSVFVLVYAAITASYFICRSLKLSTNMSILIACGNAICGNSAIAAISPIIRASQSEVASSISFTAILGVITVLSLPFLYDALNMTMTQFGTLAGLTVYAVPQVLAATVPVGPVAVQVGTLVKLMRVLMLGPVCLILSVIYHRNGQRESGATKFGFGKMVPWFIIGFILMLAARSIGLIPEGLVAPISLVASLLTTVAMAALGLGVDVRVVARAGGRVTAAVTLSLAMLAVTSIILIKILGIR